MRFNEIIIQQTIDKLISGKDYRVEVKTNGQRKSRIRRRSNRKR